jgi:PH domain
MDRPKNEGFFESSRTLCSPNLNLISKGTGLLAGSICGSSTLYPCVRDGDAVRHDAVELSSQDAVRAALLSFLNILEDTPVEIMDDTHSQPYWSQNHLPLHLQSVDTDHRLHSELATAGERRTPVHFPSNGRVWTHPSQKKRVVRQSPERPPVRPLVLDATASPSSLRNRNHPDARSSSWNAPSSAPPRQQPPPVLQYHESPRLPHRLPMSHPQKAGYLYKLGVNIPIYKRRFFRMEKSRLSLQYFLSPYDAEPRGCYNIYNARIEHNISFDDGEEDDSTVYRFAIVWDDVSAVTGAVQEDSFPEENAVVQTQPPQPKRIELEARSKQDARQWIRTIESEQVSLMALQQITTAQDDLRSKDQQIKELQKEIANFKYMEQERDDAVADATLYKSQLGHLDEAIRLLTQQIRRRNTSMADDTTTGGDVSPGSPSPATSPDIEKGGSDHVPTDIGNGLPPGTELLPPESGDEMYKDAEPGAIASSPEKLVPLDLDICQVPGTHFSALHNAVEQLHENIRLSSIEAMAAVEDVTAAQERVAVMEQRTAKIEKHLCKIWEENCSLRKTMKQIKREKRVLVREIKSLRESIAAKDKATRTPVSKAGKELKRNFTEEFLDASDEEKLINELEEHVLSSIRLHEEFLSSVRLNDTPTNIVPDELLSSSTESDRLLLQQALDPQDAEIKSKQTLSLHPSVPLFEQNTLPTAMASLMDESDAETTADEASEQGEFDANTTTPIANTKNRSIRKKPVCPFFETPVLDSEVAVSFDEPELPNPLLHLDDDDYASHRASSDQPNLCTASSQSESSKSVHTQEHKATCQLSCPLNDLIVTSTTSAATGASFPEAAMTDDELQVYHITFYSRKIGIQFQRVPPAPVKAKGLLTEAMTDDLTLKSKSTLSGGGATAAELRRIAAISHRAKASPTQSCTMNLTRNEECQLAVPVDAVLVCGFHGFDESNTTNCIRPKLGARLVAFDGVSIEVGKWTFSAVRKAIQSCGRPLTLSFRNDYLTTEQRTILTKAVLESDQAASGSLHTKPPPHDPSKTKGMWSTMAKNPRVDFSELCDRDGPTRTMTDDLSESMDDGSDHLNSFPQSFSGNRSVTSLAQYRSFYETRSLGSSSVGGNDKIRSFSEAGSATTTATNSSVLSAIGPLMSSLLRRPQSTAASFTPEYLRRAPEFVENTPQHQDFQSELL